MKHLNRIATLTSIWLSSSFFNIPLYCIRRISKFHPWERKPFFILDCFPENSIFITKVHFALSLSLSLTHTHTHTHTHTLSLSLSLSTTHTHYLSLFLIHKHTLTHYLFLPLLHAYTHAYTHTISLSLSLSWCTFVHFPSLLFTPQSPVAFLRAKHCQNQIRQNKFDTKEKLSKHDGDVIRNSIIWKSPSILKTWSSRC